MTNFSLRSRPFKTPDGHLYCQKGPLLRRPKATNILKARGDACQTPRLHLENFGQPKSHDINRCFPLISVFMGPEFKETSITNFKNPDQSTHQLSASNAISTSIKKICINDPDLSLPTSIKASLKHQRILHQLCSLLLLSCRVRQVEERVASVVVTGNDTCQSNPEPPSLWSHSRSCSSPRGRFHPRSFNAFRHLGAPHSGDFTSAQDNHGNRSSLIFADSYAA